MTGLREAADRYLAIRRSLGYKLKIEGRMLGQFVGFCDARGLQHVTVAAALAWATAPAGADVSWSRVPQIRWLASPREGGLSWGNVGWSGGGACH